MSTVFLKKIKKWKEKRFCGDTLHENEHIHDKKQNPAAYAAARAAAPIGTVGQGKRFLEKIKPGRRV